jgi:hypothetical protein
LRFRVPFSTSRLRRVACPTDASRSDDPASAFSPPARALACEPISAASARAVLRSRRRGLVPVVVADVFGVAPLDAPRERGGSTDDLFPLTSAAVGVLVGRSRADSHRRTRHYDRRLRSPVHISRRRLAPSPVRDGVIRRGRFSHAAFRTRLGLRSLAGRLGFFPLAVRRRSWGSSALRRFAPGRRVDARGEPRG